MNITEFAKSRNVEAQAVSIYIRRHPKEFEGLTAKDGKDVILSDSAIEILDKVYPLPSPVQVIVDHESRDQLIKAQQTIIQLQQQLNQQTELISDAKFQRYLLDQKDRELDEQKKLLDQQSQELEDLKADIKKEQERSAAVAKESLEQTTQAQTERDAAKEEIKRLEAELAAAQEEANSFKRSFLGFYRKKK